MSIAFKIDFSLEATQTERFNWWWKKI